MWFQNLKNFFKNIPTKYILLTIVVLGFGLRVNNLTIGFPQLFVSNDEAIYHQSALNMLAEKTPFTLGNYGPLGAYLQIPLIILAFAVMFVSGKIASVRDFEILLVTQEGYLLFIPRILSALFGTLMILVIYKISSELFKDKNTALWSSFLAAVSFNLVHISHFARPWSGAMFFALSATFFSVKSIRVKNEQLKYATFSFISAAVAFGFHQLSGIIVFLIVLILVFGQKNTFKKLWSKNIFFPIFLWFFLIFIFNWLSLGGDFLKVTSPNNPKVGLIVIPQNINGILEWIAYFVSPERLFRVIIDLLLTDGLVAVLAMLFFAKRLMARTSLAFLIFIIFNFILVVTLLPPLLRYFLISIAILPIFAGHFLATNLRLFNRNLILVITIAIVSFNSLYWNYLILKEPTFNQVRSWIGLNIAPEIPIATMTRRNVGYTPTASASTPIREFNQSFYFRAANLVEDHYLYNVRNILYVNEFEGKTKAEKLQKALDVYPVTYVIDSYLRPFDRLLRQSGGIRLDLVAHFSPTGDKIYEDYIPEALFDAPTNFPLLRLARPGPYFDVLKVVSQPNIK